MAKATLDKEEVWEVIDAGLQYLGYTKDRTHDAQLQWQPLALIVHEPGSRIKRLAKEKKQPGPKIEPLSKELLFKDYTPAPYVEDKPDRLQFLDRGQVVAEEKPRLHRGLLALSIGTGLGLLAYNLAQYLW